MENTFEKIGASFTNTYFNMFDTSRESVGQFYLPNAMLTFEGDQVQGPEAIVAKFKSLTFQKVQHVITTTDTQPTTEGGVIILVVGQLKTDDDPPNAFIRTFCLKPVNGSFAVFHDIFRLGLHNL
ncbi:nuclear transport factor 2 [Lingula anatina]|uniref:Nuclear transport factor 2 n=1 Tax=Lingula anatina TaxID=7574 RepID=A0A1S3HSP4_LINAN|nr:nuclear transport factor 2 [Lingula anatina]|eukprot:XP_013389048.1 nuclear transport factor 2 [Lingula anatina]